MPFCGVNSIKIKRQLKRMFSAVAPWIELFIVFKPSLKFNVLSKLKDVLPVCSRSHVVYKINCTECQDFYIGMTCRRLKDRLSEHMTSDASALHQHSSSTGHEINFAQPEILARDSFKTRLLIKETLKIQEFRAYKSLNRNVGSYELNLW